MVDVLIILAGGMGRLCAELGYPPEQVGVMVAAKLAVNRTKYPEEAFFGITASWAICRCRQLWSVDPDEWGDGGEYY